MIPETLASMPSPVSADLTAGEPQRRVALAGAAAAAASALDRLRVAVHAEFTAARLLGRDPAEALAGIEAVAAVALGGPVPRELAYLAVVARVTDPAVAALAGPAIDRAIAAGQES